MGKGEYCGRERERNEELLVVGENDEKLAVFT